MLPAPNSFIPSDIEIKEKVEVTEVRSTNRSLSRRDLILYLSSAVCKETSELTKHTHFESVVQEGRQMVGSSSWSFLPPSIVSPLDILDNFSTHS